MTRTSALRAGLLLPGAIAVQFSFAQQQQPAPEMDAATRARLAPQIELVLRPDAMDLEFTPAYPRPKSAWVANEKAFYERLLTRERFDVLVVPFQVELTAISRSARSLLSARLAQIVAAGGVSVPDTDLVARALGESQRRFDADDVYRLADKLVVRRIVWAYVGHDRRGNMRMLLQSQERQADGWLTARTPMTAQRFNLRLVADQHPLEEFDQHAAAIAAAVGARPPQPLRKVKEGKQQPLPNSLVALTRGGGDAAGEAYRLQLLAALTPRSAERARERLLEKSLLALDSVSPDSPSYRYLKARALMALGHRLAALTALGTASTGEEKHLLEVMNGNLPEAQAMSREVKQTTAAILAWLDTNEIARAYGAAKGTTVSPDLARFKLPGEAWPWILTRAANDGDLWAQYSNAEVKDILDRELPLLGYSLQEIARGSTVTTSDAALAVELSVLNHVRRMREKLSAAPCCRPGSYGASQRDYLDFMEALGTDNLLRHGKFLASVQGNPQAAMSFIGKLDASFNDHPQFTVVRARAQLDLAQRMDGVAKDGYLKSAFVDASNALLWEQGATATAAQAYQVFVSVPGQGYMNWDNTYARDEPVRPGYPAWQAGGRPAPQVATLRKALDNATFDSTPLDHLSWLLVKVLEQPQEFDQLLAGLSNRFHGNTEVALIRANFALSKGDETSAIGFYDATIKAGARSWDPYGALGKLFFEKGEREKAVQVFDSFPGFKSPADENAVALSNHAAEAGSVFFWAGDFARARPFYSIAAGLNTGSEASLQAAQRLALVDGDFATAAAHALQRGQQYNSSYGYRDYLGLLHAFGYSRDAWDGFNVLVTRVDRPQIWETALTGHRLEHLSQKQIAEWASKEPLRATGARYDFPGAYVLRAAVTDRTPSPEDAAILEKLARPVWQLQNHARQVFRPTLDGRTEAVLGPDAPASGMLPVGFSAGAKTRVKSDLVYYLQAYTAARARKYKDAATLLEEAAALYDVRNVDNGYLLPLLAFSAAKAGDVREVERQLARFKVEHRRFDYFLARAAIDGLQGRVDESLKSLDLALHRRPFTEFRPLFTEYQYCEIAEWLYEATADERYRKVALDWARQNQVLNPWHAWPYAVEAKLSKEPLERRRAIAMGHFLDRDSDRLRAVPAAEVAAAVKERGNGNPFADSLQKKRATGT